MPACVCRDGHFGAGWYTIELAAETEDTALRGNSPFYFV